MAERRNSGGLKGLDGRLLLVLLAGGALYAIFFRGGIKANQVALLVMLGAILAILFLLGSALWQLFNFLWLPRRLPRTLALLRADNKTVNLARWRPKVVWWRSRWRPGHWTIVLHLPTDFTISQLENNMEAIRMDLGFEPIFREIEGWHRHLVEATCLTGRMGHELGYDQSYQGHPAPTYDEAYSVGPPQHSGHTEDTAPPPQHHDDATPEDAGPGDADGES